MLRGKPFWRLRLLLTLLGISLVAIIVIGQVNPALLGRVKTERARFGRVETGLVGRAIWLRQDDVVTAPVEGVITLLASPGRRVQAGDLIAEIDARRMPVAEAATIPSGSSDPLAAEWQHLTSTEHDLTRRLVDAEMVMRDALTSGDGAIIDDARLRRDDFRAQLQKVQEQLSQLERRMDEAEAARRAARLTGPGLEGVTLVRAPVAGLLYNGFDGLESSFRPGRPLGEWVEQLDPRPQTIGDGASVKMGQPVVRLAQPERSEIVVTLKAFPLYQGMVWHVAFDFLPQRTFAATVTEVQWRGSHVIGRLRLDDYDDAFAHQRETAVTLYPQDVPGIIVPTSAVTEKDGQPGVYMMLGDQAIFREASVLGDNREEVIIDAAKGVPVDAPIVVNPRALR